MWERRTFHQCADEQMATSERFRAAYTRQPGIQENERDQILRETSERGLELLRILALSIRTEQDFGVIPDLQGTVGAVKEPASDADVLQALQQYRPPYNEQPGFRPLGLREALNKIAHLDPLNMSFYASEIVHDLILTGNRRGITWVALISVIDLCSVIKAIPDQRVRT